MKKLQAKLRYDANFRGLQDEYYVLEIRSDTNDEYGLCMATPVKDGKISVQLLEQIMQLIYLGYKFEPYYDI